VSIEGREWDSALITTRAGHIENGVGSPGGFGEFTETKGIARVSIIAETSLVYGGRGGSTARVPVLFIRPCTLSENQKNFSVA